MEKHPTISTPHTNTHWATHKHTCTHTHMKKHLHILPHMYTHVHKHTNVHRMDTTTLTVTIINLNDNPPRFVDDSGMDVDQLEMNITEERDAGFRVITLDVRNSLSLRNQYRSVNRKKLGRVGMRIIVDITWAEGG